MNARQKTVRAAGMSIIVKAGIKQVSKRETFRAQGKWKIMKKDGSGLDYRTKY